MRNSPTELSFIQYSNFFAKFKWIFEKMGCKNKKKSYYMNNAMQNTTQSPGGIGQFPIF